MGMIERVGSALKEVITQDPSEEILSRIAGDFYTKDDDKKKGTFFSWSSLPIIGLFAEMVADVSLVRLAKKHAAEGRPIEAAALYTEAGMKALQRAYELEVGYGTLISRDEPKRGIHSTEDLLREAVDQYIDAYNRYDQAITYLQEAARLNPAIDRRTKDVLHEAEARFKGFLSNGPLWFDTNKNLIPEEGNVIDSLQDSAERGFNEALTSLKPRDFENARIDASKAAGHIEEAVSRYVAEIDYSTLSQATIKEITLVIAKKHAQAGDLYQLAGDAAMARGEYAAAMSAYQEAVECYEYSIVKFASPRVKAMRLVALAKVGIPIQGVDLLGFGTAFRRMLTKWATPSYLLYMQQLRFIPILKSLNYVQMQKVATAMVEAGIRGADRGTVKLEDIADFLSSSGYDGLAEQIYTEIEARMGGKTTKTFSLKDARRAVDSYLGGLKGPKKKAWEGLLPAERERRREAYAAEIVTSVRRGPERMMKNLGRLDILVGRSIQNVDALHPSGVERERGMGIDIERRERDAERPRGKRFRGRL